MAISIAVIKRFPPEKGGLRRVMVEITGDSSYPTGGTAIAASDLKLSEIYMVHPANPYPLVDRIYLWDHANLKLMAQVPSTGAEVANTTNCSADKVRAQVIGR